MRTALSVWSESELASLLHGYSSAAIIGIDGLQGSGKSRTALRLGEMIGWRGVHADEFIRFPRHYPELLDLATLGSAVSAVPGPVLLDSILVKVVLEALGMPTAPCVYVRRRNSDRSLVSPQYYEDFRPETMLATARDEYLLIGASPDEPMLECELIEYHQRYDPVQRALAVFENVAGS